jgi:hypothetical protein
MWVCAAADGAKSVLLPMLVMMHVGPRQMLPCAMLTHQLRCMCS